MKQLLLLHLVLFSLLLISLFYSCKKEEIKSDDGTLKGLFIDGVLIGNYNPQLLYYELTLDYGDNIPEVTAEATNPNATINIIQASDIPGEAQINVLAEDEISSNTYKIIFFETVPSKDITIDSVLVNGLNIDEFTTEQNDYLVELPSSTTKLPVVTAFAKDKNAEINIIQISELSETAIITITSQDKTLTREYTIQFIVKPDTYKLLTLTVWEAILLEIPERDYSIETSDQLFFHKDYTFVWLSTKNTIEGIWALNNDETQIIINHDEIEEFSLYDIVISDESLFFIYDLEEENSTYEVHITCRIYTGSCNS